MKIQGYDIAGRMPLFQQWGRQAIREDRKDTTRRPIKPQPGEEAQIRTIDDLDCFFFDYPDNTSEFIPCPWSVGDIRVMTEPLKCIGLGVYYADPDLDGRWDQVVSNQTGKPLDWRWKRDTLSTMFMPHEAARTLCRVTSVGVERLQDISEEDAQAEGCENDVVLEYGQMAGPIDYKGLYTVERFENRWDEIYASAHAWALNEWVWVLGWERVKV